MIRFSASIDHQTTDSGFTLVEVLVALLIVGVIGAAASLRVGTNPIAIAEDESNRLRQTIESALDRSRLARAPVVWRADPDRYALTMLELGNERPIAQRELATQVMIVSVRNEGYSQQPPYELVLSGRDPGLFRIRIGSENGALFELRSTLLGKVDVVRATDIE